MVALCKMLLQPVKLLVMDEPTNHLDIVSREILKKALVKFDGTLIIGSHDRDFLQGLTEKVYEFRNKGIKEYIGDINAFLEQRKVLDFKALELSGNKSKSKYPSIPSDNKLAYEAKKQSEKDIRKAKNKLSKLEKEVEELEVVLKDLDEQLADPVRFKELSAEVGFFDGYEKKREKLDQLMGDWEKAQLVMDKLSSIENK